MPKCRVMPCIRPVDPSDSRFWPLTQHATPELTAAQARDVAHEMIRIGLDRADELLDGAELLAPDFVLRSDFNQIADEPTDETEAMCATGRKSDAAADLERMFGAAAATVVATGMAILDGRKLVLSTKQLARPLFETFVELADLVARSRTHVDRARFRTYAHGDNLWRIYDSLGLIMICDEANSVLAFIHSAFSVAPVAPCDDQGDYTPIQFASILHAILDEGNLP